MLNGESFEGDRFMKNTVISFGIILASLSAMAQSASGEACRFHVQEMKVVESIMARASDMSREEARGELFPAEKEQLARLIGIQLKLVGADMTALMSEEKSLLEEVVLNNTDCSSVSIDYKNRIR